MATYLIKSEPGEYSFERLVRDRRTSWSGVTSPAAQKHMRSIKAGDECFFYHTGSEKRIAGLATAVKNAYPDPNKVALTASGEPKFVLFDIEPVKAATRPCTLAEIKADERFEGFALLREPRLSVMPVPANLDKALRKMAGL